MIETDLLKVFGAEGDLASRSADIGVFGAGVDADEGLLIVRSLNQRAEKKQWETRRFDDISRIYGEGI